MLSPVRGFSVVPKRLWPINSRGSPWWTWSCKHRLHPAHVLHLLYLLHLLLLPHLLH